LQHLPLPFSALLKSSGEREMSTTMALNRIMALLVRDKQLGPKVVPIIPDEARTFGVHVCHLFAVLCWLVKVKLFNIFFGYWNIKTLGKFCNLLKAQFFL
jgi:hypothetical protein